MRPYIASIGTYKSSHKKTSTTDTFQHFIDIVAHRLEKGEGIEMVGTSVLDLVWDMRKNTDFSATTFNQIQKVPFLKEFKDIFKFSASIARGEISPVLKNFSIDDFYELIRTTTPQPEYLVELFKNSLFFEYALLVKILQEEDLLNLNQKAVNALDNFMLVTAEKYMAYLYLVKIWTPDRTKLSSFEQRALIVSAKIELDNGKKVPNIKTIDDLKKRIAG